jgi:hypothetical protein
LHAQEKDPKGREAATLPEEVKRQIEEGRILPDMFRDNGQRVSDAIARLQCNCTSAELKQRNDVNHRIFQALARVKQHPNGTLLTKDQSTSIVTTLQSARDYVDGIIPDMLQRIETILAEPSRNGVTPDMVESVFRHSAYNEIATIGRIDSYFFDVSEVADILSVGDTMRIVDVLRQQVKVLSRQKASGVYTEASRQSLKRTALVEFATKRVGAERAKAWADDMLRDRCY